MSAPTLVAARKPCSASASRIAPIDEAADQAGIAEAHFELRRMHVHVELRRVELNEERGDGEAVAREHVGIGGAERTGEKRIAKRPAVDEHELMERIRAVEGRQPGVA